MAWLALYAVRDYYMNIIETLFPEIDGSGMTPALALGIILFALVSICNIFVVRRKIARIRKRKD